MRVSAFLSIVMLVIGSSFCTAADAPTPTADYRIEFEAIWSAETHPVAFPPSPHFSRLVGSTHARGEDLWAPGDIASNGVEAMAEQGGTSALQQEIRQGMSTGDQGMIILGGGVGRSPGRAAATFTASLEFSFVSLVTMIAPSPDWFVGVHGLELMSEGDWSEEIVVELFAYDSGTDSGANYTSSNADVTPHEPITRLTTGSFEGQVPLGSFTFTRTDTPMPMERFERGDINADGAVDISDPVLGLIYLFAGGTSPSCLKSADVDDTGIVELTDCVYLLNYLFQSGASPAAPSGECGLDPSEDDLSCDTATGACL